MAVYEQNLNEELSAVASTRDWEKTILKDADPTFVDDDSEEEGEK